MCECECDKKIDPRAIENFDSINWIFVGSFLFGLEKKNKFTPQEIWHALLEDPEYIANVKIRCMENSDLCEYMGHSFTYGSVSNECKLNGEKLVMFSAVRGNVNAMYSTACRLIREGDMHDALIWLKTCCYTAKGSHKACEALCSLVMYEIGQSSLDEVSVPTHAHAFNMLCLVMQHYLERDSCACLDTVNLGMCAHVLSRLYMYSGKKRRNLERARFFSSMARDMGIVTADLPKKLLATGLDMLGDPSSEKVTFLSNYKSDTLLSLTFPKCDGCDHHSKELMACARCQAVNYCGSECQREDWPTHKKVCKPCNG